MTRAVPALVLGILLAATQLLPAPATGVTVDQSYPMPGQGTVTFAGHGFGHGHGMSQYGAEGAARQGKTWQQIVDFYYPGTTQATLSQRVKVLISADTSRDVVVAPRSGLTLVNRATGETWELPDVDATRWRLDVAAGKTVVDHLTGTTWIRWKAFTGDGAFTARGLPITLYVGGNAQRYRGMLLAAPPSAGSSDRDTVNVLHLDNYIKGVIPREMPASWSPAAVRAQAVAARTYAAYEMQHPRAAHYQLCDTTSCQVYGGYDAEDSRSNDAVRSTAGVILTADGKPAFTQFGSSSGGWTAPNQFSYLPAREDPYDGWSDNPVHDWTASFDVSRLERAWPGVGNLKAIRFQTRDGRGEWQGRVWSLALIGAKNGRATKVVVSGDTFRSVLGLRSTWFTVASTRTTSPRTTRIAP
jgi:stage II sporulation protein D